MNDTPFPAPGRAYLRDASWHDTIGHAGRYHLPSAVEGRECLAACSRRIMLSDNDWADADSVPEWMRCHASGCKEQWNAPL